MVGRSGLEEVRKSGAEDEGDNCRMQRGEDCIPHKYQRMIKTLAELAY
jgi:hypothetical protein